MLLLPISPAMPGYGLDMSWKMALNESVAHHMRFGTDIIFTFGPYASLYTHLYHPKLFLFTILGSLSLASSFVMALLLIIPWQKFHGRLSVLMVPFVILVLFFPLKDGFFLLYPWVYLIFYIVYVNSEIRKNNIPVWIWQIIRFGLIFNLALISLIKGTFAIACWISITLTCFYALSRKRFRDGGFLIGSYLCCLCLLWKLAGQQLFDLPVFFIAIKEVVAGYSDAMSISGVQSEIIIYGLLSASTFATIQTLRIQTKSRLFIFAGIGMALFLFFKAGFVRHDGHAMIAASGLLGIVFLIYILRGSIATLVLLFLAAGFYADIIWHYTKIAPLALGKEFVSRVAAVPEASTNLLWHYAALNKQYKTALDNIRREGPLPGVTGTADIISYGQGRLVAAGIQYRPRPVIQSYSAYTPYLMKKNADFLKGSKAPDNIFFAVEPIDGRLPALEDGELWLVLIDRYEFVAQRGDIAHFRLRSSSFVVPANAMTKDLGGAVTKLGGKVVLPQAPFPLWVEIKVQSTWLGHIRNAFFKLPELEIVITTTDGAKHPYRYIASMGESGFLLSPLIKSSDDFVVLALGQANRARMKHVKSIQINEVGSWQGVWRRPWINLHFFGIPALGNEQRPS